MHFIGFKDAKYIMKKSIWRWGLFYHIKQHNVKHKWANLNYVLVQNLNLRPLTLSNNLLNLQNLHNNEQPKAYVLQVPSNLCPSHSY
jgi:hypothetical protein